MFSKFNKGKFIERLLQITLIIAVGGLNLATLHVISPEAGILSFLPHFVVWAVTFGDF